MIDTRVIVVASVAYLALLYAFAYFGDRRASITSPRPLRTAAR